VLFNSSVLDVTGATEGSSAAAQWHTEWRHVQCRNSLLQHSLSLAALSDRRLYRSCAQRSVTFVHALMFPLLTVSVYIHSFRPTGPITIYRLYFAIVNC